MNIIVVPDSFKGTMTSQRVCDIFEEAIAEKAPGISVTAIPVADGGEGTVDAYLLAAGGRKVFLKATGPHFSKVDAFYGVLRDKTAVVELAAASGLTLSGEHKNPMDATTRGTGELICDAVRDGCTRVILGVGGSATMDGGAGLAGALGVRFLDADGAEVAPTAAGIGRVRRIDASGVREEIRKLEFLVACDVDNVLCGPGGAAAVFGPQKGASAQEAALADRNLAHLAEVIREETGKDLANVPGTGAAGGVALPLLAFFNTKLAAGIDLVLDAARFEDKLATADLVITGEGRLDGQSAAGKVPVGVARRAKRAGVPVAAVAGVLGEGFEAVYDEGVTAVFQTGNPNVPFEVAKRTAERDLRFLAESLAALLGCARKGGG